MSIPAPNQLTIGENRRWNPAVESVDENTYRNNGMNNIQAKYIKREISRFNLWFRMLPRRPKYIVTPARINTLAMVLPRLYTAKRFENRLTKEYKDNP